MARMTFRAAEEYELKLSRLSYSSPEIVKAAIAAGAKVVADAIRKALEALPTDKFRFLRDGEKYIGPTEREKADMLESFGITPIQRDRDDNWNAKIGFDGYGSLPTKKYPKGVPNQLVARSVESGSTVRKKTPFVRNTVNQVKKTAQDAMAKATDEELEKLWR